MSSTRTDIHRPSAEEFDPTDYFCAGFFYLGRPEGIGEDLARWHRSRHSEAIERLEAEGTVRGGVHGTRQCSHCGAHLSYVALMVHRPTNTYLHIGEDCLDNRFELESKAAFQAMRKEIAAGRKAQKLTAKIEALIEAHPLLAELTYIRYDECRSQFLCDLSTRLRMYGELSDRQIEAVERTMREGIRRQAQRDAEDAAAKPAPLGRVVVCGEVISIQDKETDFGRVWKMTVRTQEGWAVYVTVPSNLDLDDLPHGTVIEFTATLKRAEKNPRPGFVFGSRPTKARIVQ